MRRSLIARMAGDDGERGVYAVLYAALAVVMIGMGALVVDIASVRENRRDNRAAADSAATAGAEFLSELAGVDPEKACLQAWAYLISTRRVKGDSLVPPPGACSKFSPSSLTPATAAAYCATASPALIKDERKIGSATVIIAWPVPRDTAASPSASQGFLAPDLAPGTAPVQEFNTDADGSDKGCDRLGVAILENSKPGLASGIGFSGDIRTTVHSVARNFISDNNEVIAALNVLDRSKCGSLKTSGGKVIVRASGVQPGIIAVESTGRENSAGQCPNSQPYVIDPQDNANNLIRADGPGASGGGQGVIQAYALNAAPKGNPPDAFKAGISASVLAPTPTRMPKRYGETLVTDIYACTGAAPVPNNYPDVPLCTNPVNHVARLKAALGGGGSGTSAPVQYSGAPAAFYNAPPATPVGFQELPVPAPVPVGTPADIANFKCTTNTSDPKFVIPAGNWWVRCPTLSLNNLGIFQGGTLVFDGGINVGSSSGCLVVNITATTCPTVNTSVSPPTTSPAPNATDAIVYMRGGTGAVDTVANNLTKGSQSAIYMPRTFVFQDRNAAIAMGAGSGPIVWTAPLAADCAAVKSCEQARFKKLMLWSDTTSPQAIGGQAQLLLRGVLFVPKSQVNYNGQASTLQNQAQFWAWRIELSGSNTELIMAADADNAIPRPVASVSLIR